MVPGCRIGQARAALFGRVTGLSLRSKHMYVDKLSGVYECCRFGQGMAAVAIVLCDGFISRR